MNACIRIGPRWAKSNPNQGDGDGHGGMRGPQVT